MNPSGSKRRHDDRRNGFSFVEVLAALALTLALVSVVMPFTARLIERWADGERRIQDADAWMRLTARLSADVASAVPLPASADKQSALLFRADRNMIVLVRPARAGGDDAGLQISAYVIEHAGAGDSLVHYGARYSPAMSEVDPRQFGGATAVMTGPFRFSFAAVGADGIRSAQWLDRKDMPAWIELAAVPIGDSPAPASPLRLPIAAQTPRSDPSSRGGSADARPG
ncbi:MAG TPA: hypothetical protein VGC77_14390 [Rhodopseudomonas sp.]|uniref:hypothetical protein n=1 Tax=Rhodopseudomonas sp. TaxID=1078 RepID=UPI002ED998EB